MAEDAFALSPISARASLPTEADYEAICGAFMETARGRWFLGEYAKRNRNADTRMVLDAVERIEATLAKQKETADRSLAELMPAISDLVAEARRRIVEGLPKTDARPSTEPIQRAAGVLRDVAWTLRESGADTRVCDLLDVQAKAIVDGCARIHGDQTTAPDPLAAIGAALDALMLQIGSLVRSEARPVAAQPTAPAEPPVEARADAPVEPVPPQVSGDTIDATVEVVEPVEPTLAATPQEAHLSERLPASQPAERAAAAPAAALLTAIEADVQAGLWDDLEIIDVDPDERLVDVDRTVSEPPAAPRAEAAVVVATATDPPAAETATPLADVPSAPAADRAVPEPIVADPEPALKAAPSSLGQAALDSGIVTAAASRHLDVLAPIRRMSQAEKIAFFS